MAGGQYMFGGAQMLQHVGTDDVVILPRCKSGEQVAGFQVGHHHAAVMRSGVGGLGLAPGQAVAGALAGFQQVLAQGAAAAAQIQHRGAFVH